LGIDIPMPLLNFGLSSKFTYLKTQSISEDDQRQEFDSKSNLYKSRLLANTPLYMMLLGSPVSLEADFQPHGFWRGCRQGAETRPLL